MKDQLVSLLTTILSSLGVTDIVPQVEIPENADHGEYTTNVAMIAAKQLGKKPREVAEEIKNKLSDRSFQLSDKKGDQKRNKADQKESGDIPEQRAEKEIARVEIAGPGFINFYLTEASLISQGSQMLKNKELAERSFQLSDKKKKIMVEFAHPNTHKSFHIGHLRNITTGESMVRLLEATGHEVIRANYQGDVGMHIAKAIYGLLLECQMSNAKCQIMIEEWRQKPIQERVAFLGKTYAAGSKAYEEDEKAKEIIHDYNYLVYASAQRFAVENGKSASSTDYMKFVHGRETDVELVFQLWKETRQWSLDYFETIYKRVGTHYDRYYFESECLAGVDIAKDAVKKGVLKESDGAIILDGKPYGIDTRVFVNSLGLPTYEAKELKLSQMETTEFGHIDQIVHVVGPEQSSFFIVTFKAEELLGIQKDQQYHLAYGWVKLKHGKMSSRSGNVVLGEWLIDEAKKEIIKILDQSDLKADQNESKKSDAHKLTSEEKEEVAEKGAVAAVKYAFLKVATKSEIAFDFGESVSFTGDSGPYLQYTYARCKSVLRKAGKLSAVSHQLSDKSERLSLKAERLNSDERLVLRRLMYFPQIVGDAASRYAPNVLCTYLFQLAQEFNLFYSKHSILESDTRYVTRDTKNSVIPDISHLTSHISPTTELRVMLTTAVAETVKKGLWLLGIEVVEKM